ncbi:MAG: 4Fe-4S dicluster domain-containing protein [Ignavibacteriales bacterium]|nr:4Fe-4S dicluster domain-containing protein [Ignavibacteriales bacterium]MBI3788365.1 4Fe-4S dicluster domain-containing protein [Ignavibacteriales bacterium]
MITKKAMLIDITLCIGCNACQEACKKANNLAEGEEKKLSPSAYTALEEHDGVFVRRMCQHCEEPTCASVCPVGAFTKTPEGPVLYDENKCIGCRYCMQACPFQVPRYEWGSTYPRVQKCVFCHGRITQGLQPACAEACPTGATKFGNRDELISEALERMKAEPAKYVNRIYGQHEVGGTSILYITNVPFEQLGFKTELQATALPTLTWNALSKIPGIVTVGGVFLYGIWWITNRRTEVQRFERKLEEMERRSNGDGNHS